MSKEKKMYSEFGKYLRVLRLNRGELLKTMADRLEVSSAFLSSVETGKKAIPSNWENKIALLYQLNEKEKDALRESITQSKASEKLILLNNSAENVGIALQFARRFNEKTISDSTLNEIMKLLSKDEED